MTPKPTVPDVLPLVHDLYRRHAAGCCLHVALDDGNVDDSDVALCLGKAREEGHERCEKLAKLLQAMSRTQRRKLHEAPKPGSAAVPHGAHDVSPLFPEGIAGNIGDAREQAGDARGTSFRLPPFPAPWVELHRDEGPDHQTLVGLLEPPQGAALLRLRTVTRTGVADSITVVPYAELRWLRLTLTKPPEPTP